MTKTVSYSSSSYQSIKPLLPYFSSRFFFSTARVIMTYKRVILPVMPHVLHDSDPPGTPLFIQCLSFLNKG